MPAVALKNHPAAYDKHAFIQKEVGLRLLERFDTLSYTPHRLLDIGAGTGNLTRQLQKRFSQAFLIGLDLSKERLDYAQQSRSLLRRHQPRYLCADTHYLPCLDNTFDGIFSNLTLHWCTQLPLVLQECKRILKPGGLLLFSMAGPDTLKELRESWQHADEAVPHVNPFPDMHDIGDLLLKTGFARPVMEMEKIQVNYACVKTLLKDLKSTGSYVQCQGYRQGCTPPSRLTNMLAHYARFQMPDRTYPATFEVVYGHAWQPAKVS